MPRLSLIVAIATNGVIGRSGKLPWRLSADLKRFKSLTMGHHLIMGRKTFESIGRPLPGRATIVLTRRAAPLVFDPSGTLPLAAARSLAEALELARDDDEAFVIGGAEIYALALPQADRLYVTWVDAAVEGHTFFPEFELDEWRLVSQERHEADAKNEFPHRFAVYDRIPDRLRRDLPCPPPTSC